MQGYRTDFLNELSMGARKSERLRLHHNIHLTYDDHCQRLFNAIEPGSYIQPHRHLCDNREETLVAIRGVMAVIRFSDSGIVLNVEMLDSGDCGRNVSRVICLPSSQWHTVVALVPGSILLEVKEGPFIPAIAKDLAPWAPGEKLPESLKYYQYLDKISRSWCY
jgi:cupin fold WbuC family metalloprotein